MFKVSSLVDAFRKYSAGEGKSPLFIFLHDQLPFFWEKLGEIVENFSRFLQEISVFLPEILKFCL